MGRATLLAREWSDKLRRRVEEGSDQLAVALSRLGRRHEHPVPYDGTPRISVVVVNWNTLPLTKLMLLTLAAQVTAGYLLRVVIVDNGSRDGSQRFFGLLPHGSRLHCTVNGGHPTHAAGLRAGISYIESLERGLAGAERTNLYLVVDSDVIFLREFLPQLVGALHREEAGVAGEVQHDVGEPYVHPSCLLLRRDVYEDPRVFPFVNHGAPALWMQRSMRRAGYRIADLPLRSANYIVHRGRSTIDSLSTFERGHSYASLPDKGPHYHGNPRGHELWNGIVASFATLLHPQRELEAINWIAARLSGSCGASDAPAAAGAGGKGERGA